MFKSVGGLRCLDGSSLAVIPVASLDRGGVPYEFTLRLERNGEAFGAVGQRCGYILARLARRVSAARRDDSPQAERWPDPDDRFPEPPLARALRAHVAACGHREPLTSQLPREPELFAFRYRDRGDLASTGELRCTLRTSSAWISRARHAPFAGEPDSDPRGPGGSEFGAPARPGLGGEWRLARRAIVEAWGAGGRGVRAVLTSGDLARFLYELVSDAERAGTSYRDVIDRESIRRSGR